MITFFIRHPDCLGFIVINGCELGMPTSYEGRTISNIYEREEIVVRIDAYVQFIKGLLCHVCDILVIMFLEYLLNILYF